LAEDASVTLTISDLMGQVVRTFKVGHQPATVYDSKEQAIYWDGRNDTGEPVSSGIYFYHLQAGDFAATKKLIILK
jgi:flagellar hook assembly protein FlgD